MKYDRVLNHFGGLSKTAQVLGLKRQTVHVWGVRKKIPARWQLKIESITSGNLKADNASRRVGLEIASYMREHQR